MMMDMHNEAGGFPCGAEPGATEPRRGMFDNFPDVLTVEEMQKALSIGRTYAYRLISSGAIKHWKIGRAIKIPKHFLIDYISDSCYNTRVAGESPPQGGIDDDGELV